MYSKAHFSTVGQPMTIQNQSTVGLKVAVSILEKWQATGEQCQAILCISADTYAHVACRDPEWQVNLDDDQLTRISLVLNIHAALRVLFDNPSNVDGFMTMVNHNDFFDGRTPLEVIGQGDFDALRAT